jgi:hypothetical protein
MISTIKIVLLWILSIPALIARFLRQIAQYIASERWYLWGFIPCSAGLWPLGLYCWHKDVQCWYYRFPLRVFSYICFLFGTILFFEGLWPFAGILLLVRLLIWLDDWLRLSDPLVAESAPDSTAGFKHPFDKLSLCFIGAIFIVLAVNKERLIDFSDPSDQFYHMAVAKQILEKRTIPIWDDWEFAPMGRPHLYPPVLHLLIAFFAGEPDQIIAGFSSIQMLLYPLALLAYWLLYRKFLSPAHAYLSLIFLSMEFMFGMGCLMGLPASIVNVLWPFILLALINKRTYVAILLLAVAFYTHTGMPALICLCLLIFGLWKREHFLRILAVIIGALILSIPWTLRYYVFSDWMQASGAQGFSFSSIVARLLWLQIANPVFIVLAVWGLFRLKQTAIFKSQILGFLPMLTQYGGRFFMHGAPFLSPFIAVHFKRFLEGNVTRRRALFSAPNPDTIALHKFHGSQRYDTTQTIPRHYRDTYKYFLHYQPHAKRSKRHRKSGLRNPPNHISL